MGQMIHKLAVDRGHRVVSIIQEENLNDLDSIAFKSADVAIEFSTPSAAPNNLRACFERNIPVVCGTTAWLDQLESIHSFCKEKNGGFLYASNFSLGVNLFFELNQKLANLMNGHTAYKAQIKEIHHTQKLDAPSGTAISLANELIDLHTAYNSYGLESNSTLSNDTLPIIAERIDKVPGTHIVSYTSDIDQISIKHEAFSRKGFALGALIAAEFLIGKQGIYTMKDVLAQTL